MESSRDNSQLFGASVASFLAGAFVAQWLASRRRRYANLTSDRISSKAPMPFFAPALLMKKYIRVQRCVALRLQLCWTRGTLIELWTSITLRVEDARYSSSSAYGLQ